MADKFCVFCGNKPQDKNLEHIIPQWLIKMTGRERKDVFVNFPESEKHINFMNYKFPACTKCNSKYAELEAKVRPIMIDVLDNKPISGFQASLLMDWFDKVRVGLWLSRLYLEDEMKYEITPHFYIDSRVAQTDRMLSIYRINMHNNEKGISFIGTTSELFTYFPSAFILLINDVCFVNAATHNLVSPRVGFPTMTQAHALDPLSGKFSFELQPGRHAVKNPVITTFIPKQDSITFYQPIVKTFADDSLVSKDKYIIEHTYDISNGLGGVFVQKGNVGNTRYLTKSDRIGTKTKPIESSVPDVVIEALKIQNIAHDKCPVASYQSEHVSNIYQKVVEQYKKGHVH